MAQQPIGDKSVRDALATYRKLDERINAQMLAARQHAEASRGPEAVQDSVSPTLGGSRGLPSFLETPAAGPGGRPIEGTSPTDGIQPPPASFRMGSRAWNGA